MKVIARRSTSIKAPAPDEETVRTYVKARWPGAIEHLDETGHKVTYVKEKCKWS